MSVPNGAPGATVNCDVLVVGAGFGGVYAIHKFRQLGLNVKAFEAGGDFGGVWYWNRYPGARVDSEFPFYQLTIPEVYRDWNYGLRFPDHKELRRHFAHIDKTLDLRKDVQFNARVNSAEWNAEEGKWTVKTEAGHVAKCKYLFLASGLLHRKHTPDFPGLANYKGEIHHSSFWPEDLSVKGKKVAVIGAGATSVQIMQELAKETAGSGSLTMFMRRPSYCLPMQQRNITKEEQAQLKSFYPDLFKSSRKSRSGFPTSRPGCKLSDATAEERERLWEESWDRGAFNFLGSNYDDVVLDLKANRAVYDFWAKKVRARMNNPAKRDLMAPLEPPYAFGTKRTPLEHDYYECLDMDHVDIVNLNEQPLKSFNEKGIVLEDGRQLDFDVVILATGFDSFSGSLTNMGLKNKDGVDMKEVWNDGISTYLGLAIHGFPNAFMVYSPHSPTAFSNGPTILECQVDMVVDSIAKLEKENAKSIEAEQAAQDEWCDLVAKMAEHTLFPLTSSWWTGGNIPGKKPQMLTYVAGIDTYEATCREKLLDWQGFKVVTA